MFLGTYATQRLGGFSPLRRMKDTRNDGRGCEVASPEISAICTSYIVLMLLVFCQLLEVFFTAIHYNTIYMGMQPSVNSSLKAVYNPPTSLNPLLL